MNCRSVGSSGTVTRSGFSDIINPPKSHSDIRPQKISATHRGWAGWAPGGTAIAVTDEELIAATKEIGAAEGVFCAPEGAACLPALKRLLEDGSVQQDECVVLFNTGSGVKYIESFSS